MKSILTYNFMQVIKACPYCKDFKCTEPYTPEMNCMSCICARKQAFYYLEAYNVLKAENEQAEQKLERIREFATALCYTVMSDGVVILQKDILKIIDEVNDESQNTK